MIVQIILFTHKLIPLCLGDEYYSLKTYCPNSNQEDKFTIVSPMLMSKVMVIFKE